jgi:hypothetical protein
MYAIYSGLRIANGKAYRMYHHALRLSSLVASRTRTRGRSSKAEQERHLTGQQASMRVRALEQAIEAVIHDLRIPQKLRSAWADYQGQRYDRNTFEIDNQPREQTEPTCLQKEIRCNLEWACQRPSSQSATHEDCCIRSCESIAIEWEMKIRVWHNDEALDWSIEINGRRYDHVTSEIMEALVECQLILAQTSLTRAFAQRPQ